MLQGDDEDLDHVHHQLLPLVRGQEIVVRDPVSHRVVSTNHVEQGGEEGEGVSGRRRGGNRGGQSVTTDGGVRFSLEGV